MRQFRPTEKSTLRVLKDTNPSEYNIISHYGSFIKLAKNVYGTQHATNTPEDGIVIVYSDFMIDDNDTYNDKLNSESIKAIKQCYKSLQFFSDLDDLLGEKSE